MSIEVVLRARDRKRKLPILLCVAFFACLGYLRANNFPSYLERSDGLQLEKQKDYLGALVRFKVDQAVLEKVREQYPAWEHVPVAKAIAEDGEKIAALEPLAANQYRDKMKGALTSGPPVSMLYDQGLKETDPWKAMNEIEEYLTTLEIIHQQDPQWESDLVEAGIEKATPQMDRLEMLAVKEVGAMGADRTAQ